MIPTAPYSMDIQPYSDLPSQPVKKEPSKEYRVFDRVSCLLTYGGGGLALAGLCITSLSMSDSGANGDTNLTALAGITMGVIGGFLWGTGHALDSL